MLTIVFITLALIIPQDKMMIGGGAFGSGMGLIAIIALGIVIARNAYPAFLPYDWLAFLDDPDIQSVIIIALIFIAVIMFITSEPKKATDESGFVRFNKGIRDLMGLENK